MYAAGKDLRLANLLRERIDRKKNNEGAGISFAIVQNHELLAACACGVRGHDKSPADISDLYNVGSVSKVYTAAAVMKLAEEGHVDLDKPVYQYLPHFRMRDPRYKEITLRMALNHSSGLSGSNSLNMMMTRWDPCGIDSRDYRYWSDSVLKADPGEFSVYCNEGFELARLVVQEVSGQSFSGFLQEKILSPAGADSAGLGEDKLNQGVLMRCLDQEPEFVLALGAGGIHTNRMDCAVFGDLFLKEGSILSKESIHEMSALCGKTFLAEDTLSPYYGLGWDSVFFQHELYDFGEGVLTKGGTTGQFGSFLLVSPQYNLSAAISVTLDTKVVNSELLCELVAFVLEDQGFPVKRQGTETKVESLPIPAEIADEICGYYYSGMGTYKAEIKDDVLKLQYYGGKGKWEDYKFFPEMKYYGDFFQGGIYKLKMIRYHDIKYLLLYLFSSWMPMLQSVPKLQPFPEAWQRRLEKKYFCVNLPTRNSDYYAFASAAFEDVGGDGVLSLVMCEGMPALPTVPDGRNSCKMVWRVPGMGGRDMVEPYFFTKDGIEYLTFFSFIYREADSFKDLPSGIIRNIHEGESLVYKTRAGMKLDFELPWNVKMLLFGKNLELLYEETVKPERSELQDGYIVFASDDVFQFEMKIRF